MHKSEFDAIHYDLVAVGFCIVSNLDLKIYRHS